MDFQTRMEKLLKASPETLEEIDKILDGKGVPVEKKERTKLMTIGEARAYLGWSYAKVRRAIADGLLDVVEATGRRLVMEESLYELASGRRQPSEEVRVRREARNAARREEYRRRKGLLLVAAGNPQTA